MSSGVNFVCDLDAQIYEILCQESLDLGAYWEINSPFRNIPNCDNEVIVANEFFRIKVGLLPVDTTELRSFLDNDMSKGEWLRHFKQRFVPILKTHGLGV